MMEPLGTSEKRVGLIDLTSDNHETLRCGRFCFLRVWRFRGSGRWSGHRSLPKPVGTFTRVLAFSKVLEGI